MPPQKKRVVITKVLGSGVRATLESFLDTNVAPDADVEFGVTAGTIDMSNFDNGSIHVVKDPDNPEQTIMYLAIGYEMEGVWTSS